MPSTSTHQPGWEAWDCFSGAGKLAGAGMAVAAWLDNSFKNFLLTSVFRVWILSAGLDGLLSTMCLCNRHWEPATEQSRVRSDPSLVLLCTPPQVAAVLTIH